MNTIEGDRAAAGAASYTLVAARFYEDLADRLVQGARGALREAGVPDASISLVQVPGAFEIPLAAKAIAASGRADAVIALGAVIRGETPHFDYVAGECAAGLLRVSLETGVPIAFGVLTTNDRQQADARSGGAQGNKGADAARTALEMVALRRALE